MESNLNYQEDLSMNYSSDEVDQDSDDLGVGRSYECVFCKRGFNTAQALGGHMNIHRKDRGRNKPNSTKQQQLHTVPRISPPDYINNNHLMPAAAAPPRFESHFSYSAAAAYVPAASTSSIRQPTSYGNYHFDSDDHRQPLNPLGPPAGDWRLNLEFAQMTNREDLEEDLSQKPQLDLELRLGYDYS